MSALLALVLTLTIGLCPDYRLMRTVQGEGGNLCGPDVLLALAHVCNDGLCFGDATPGPAAVDAVIRFRAGEPSPVPGATYAFSDSDMAQERVQRLVEGETLLWKAECAGAHVWFWGRE
jgi:hypothetical protein